MINKDTTNGSTELSKKTLPAEAEQKLFGVIVDQGSNFQSHTKSIIKTGNQTLSALIRVASFMIGFNKKIKFNSFIKRQFNYFPLIWMFSTRAVKHKINRLYERVLIILLIYETWTFFNDTLSKSNNTTSHVKNFDDRILQISRWFFGSHNEKFFLKRYLSRTFKILE